MRRFLPYLSYFLYWLLFFIAARALFLLYHIHSTSDLDQETILNIFWYGLRMDISFTAYICVLPFLLYAIKHLMPRLPAWRIVRVYSIVLIVLFSVLVTADLELYTSWGFRFDVTPFQYFKTPREMMGTASSAPVLILLLIAVLLSGIFIFLLRYFNKRILVAGKRFRWLYFLAGLFLVAVLVIPIRGGVQKIPMNISDVYFSDKPFANHAAINLPWNVFFTFLNRNTTENPYQYFSMVEAEKIMQELYSKKPESPQILSSDRPNIIFIILESFTAKLVGCLGGEPGVTPNLDSIAADGLLFKNFYASGDRSEKGQVSVLSGYPNQAINSIIKLPNKTVGLPSLTKTLESYGYSSSYTYGGELEFANIKSYLLNTGYKDLVSKYSFPASARTTSWGVHDHIVFDYFFRSLQEMPQPFFATIFSLSSHEPYDVPMHHFTGRDAVSQFKNSMYYTDSVLGDFIRKIKKETYWKNSFVVIVADHGHPLPGQDAVDQPSKFHVPLVFTGGALQKKGILSTYGSQTDIATTVLHQLRIPADEYRWGRDLLDSTGSFAFYNFNDGFGWVSAEGFATVDNVGGRLIRSSPGFDTSALRFGKAYMQVSYQDYLDR